MTDLLIYNRRQFITTAAMAAGGIQLGSLTVAAARAVRGDSDIMKSQAQPWKLKQVNAGPLSIAYAEAGKQEQPVVILLHGWPYDIWAFEEVVPILVSKGYRVLLPYARGFGETRFLARDTPRNGQQGALASDVIEFMDTLKISSAIIGGFDWGARSANILAAVWPERCRAIVAVSGYIVVDRIANRKPLSPDAELGWWYQYYFATARGQAGYRQNTYAFNRLIWKLASPKWDFDQATYERSAKSFINPDHAAIVVHNYRWRLELEEGEQAYQAIEDQLGPQTRISVPAVTIGSDFDGSAADGKHYSERFSSKHAHHILRGIGHNVPQEAPREFAAAIIQAAQMASR